MYVNVGKYISENGNFIFFFAYFNGCHFDGIALGLVVLFNKTRQ